MGRAVRVHRAIASSKIPGVTATVQREPGASLSNRSPRVTIRWDSKQFGITGAEASDLLDKGEPRIALGGGGGGGGRGGQTASCRAIPASRSPPR